MKKLFSVLVLVMTVLAVNAQRTPVKLVDLQKSVTDNVAKNYAGFTIRNATKVVTNNIVTYEVAIAKGTSQETLLYDMNGNFVKKVVAKEGTVAKQAAPANKKANPPAAKKAPVNTPIKK